MLVCHIFEISDDSRMRITTKNECHKPPNISPGLTSCFCDYAFAFVIIFALQSFVSCFASRAIIISFFSIPKYFILPNDLFCFGCCRLAFGITFASRFIVSCCLPRELNFFFQYVFQTDLYFDSQPVLPWLF